MRSRVLLVDSDAEGLASLAEFLARHGLEVLQATSVREMDQVLGKAEVDAVILDLMRPGEKGLAVCGKLREHSAAPAVIVVSAIADEADIVVGLEIGADDYVAKPCRPRELLARLRAVLRRRGEAASAAHDLARSESYRFEGWRLNVVTHQLFDPNHRSIDLSPAEFNLLRTLVAKPQEVVPRRELTPGGPVGPERADFQINVAMSRLRRKLARAEGGARLIRTVRHSGYLFTVPVERVT
uniref:response regulator transcription factor n=1 Tax=uncultured Caulobacter sp. TaxID=158749 RepID=UPI0025D6198E|nr:response regulator transcription factor [uncultured Caulobacter sp.]